MKIGKKAMNIQRKRLLSMLYLEIIRNDLCVHNEDGWVSLGPSSVTPGKNNCGEYMYYDGKVHFTEDLRDGKMN
jgi:hypothetical protein